MRVQWTRKDEHGWDPKGPPQLLELRAAVDERGQVAAWQTRDWRLAVGALLILANWPYTLLAIKPTNDRLHAIKAEHANAETRQSIIS